MLIRLMVSSPLHADPVNKIIIHLIICYSSRNNFYFILYYLNIKKLKPGSKSLLISWQHSHVIHGPRFARAPTFFPTEAIFPTNDIICNQCEPSRVGYFVWMRDPGNSIRRLYCKTLNHMDLLCLLGQRLSLNSVILIAHLLFPQKGQ